MNISLCITELENNYNMQIVIRINTRIMMTMMITMMMIIVIVVKKMVENKKPLQRGKIFSFTLKSTQREATRGEGKED